MRAMPSPTSKTRPTSWRSTSDSKPASWRLMISLISAALIMSFPRRGATPPFRTSPQGLHERSSRSNVVSLRARQTITHAVELSVEAAVKDHASDLGHEAAQPRLLRRQSGAGLELLADGVDLVALARQLEQRLRIGLRDGFAVLGHGLAAPGPIPARSNARSRANSRDRVVDDPPVVLFPE